MKREGVVAGLVLSFVSGCASLGSAAESRAQQDLGCSDVEVSDQGGGEYEATGCGSSVSYACLYGDTSELDTGLHQPVCIREGDMDVRPITAATASSPPAAAPISKKHFPLVTAVATMKLAASFAEDCNAIAGPRGAGTAEVVFATDGHPTSVTLSAPFQGTPVGECVAGKFRRVVLPAFSRGPKTTHKSFTVPALPEAASANPGTPAP